jgi:hypothetical protein
MVPYGTRLRNQQPSSQSTLQSPEAVVLASQEEPLKPFPLFHTTRVTPTAAGQAPVPPGLGVSFLARAALGRSCVSLNGSVTRLLIVSLQQYLLGVENAPTSETGYFLGYNQVDISCVQRKAVGCDQMQLTDRIN